jgi:inhibitor of cysteine peptidase
MLNIDENQNGRRFNFALSDEFEITLAENPTTGFRWELEDSPEPVCAIILSVFDPHTSPAGHGGVHRWRLRAVQNGLATCKLAYKRPWEQKSVPERSFEIHLSVM